MAWTDERIDQLRKLWEDGLSASQIATELGEVTRNAVIGKMHRLGLSGRMKASSQQARVRRQRIVSRPAFRKPAPPRTMAASNTALKVVAREETPPEEIEVVRAEVVQAEIVPLHGTVGLLDLKEDTCRWPLGDPDDGELRFCGRPSPAGQPYCSGHRSLAFQAPASRKKRDDGSSH